MSATEDEIADRLHDADARSRLAAGVLLVDDDAPAPDLFEQYGLEPAENDEGRSVGVEVVIAGKHVEFGRPPACEHRSVNAEVISATIVDDDGLIVKREVLLKARCGECGCSYRLLPETAHESRTVGDLGLVAEIEPTE